MVHLRGNGSAPDLDGKRKSEMGLLSSPDSQQERITLYCFNVDFGIESLRGADWASWVKEGKLSVLP